MVLISTFCAVQFGPTTEPESIFLTVIAVIIYQIRNYVCDNYPSEHAHFVPLSSPPWLLSYEL